MNDPEISSSAGTGSFAGTSAIDETASRAHQTVDRLSDASLASVQQVSNVAHRALDSAVNAAAGTAETISEFAAEAQEQKAKLAEAVCDGIKARPFTAVASALAVGYLVGCLSRS